MSSIHSILDAATTLSHISNADRENLLVHRDKLEAALRNLKSLLKTRDETGSGRSVLNFLERNEPDIREWFQNAGELDIESDGDWADEDPRVVDLSIVDQDSSLDEKFRSGLSAISLATTYMEWERDRLQKVRRKGRRKARVDALCQDLKAGNRSTFYKEYVDGSDNFRDKDKAKRYIEYGVKCLVFGRIYLWHNQVYAGNMPTDVHFGVLGILFLTSYFRRMTYPDIPLLVTAILSSDWRRLAEEKTQWVSSRLKANEDRIERILAHSRKRRNLEKENPYEHPNKRSRNEDVAATTSNNAELHDSLDNLLEVDPLGLPYFDYPLDRNSNPTFSDEHARLQEHIIQDFELADLNPLGQLLTVNPLGSPHFGVSIPQNSPPLPSTPAAIPSERIATEVAMFLAGMREKDDGTSNVAGNTAACMV